MGFLLILVIREIIAVPADMQWKLARMKTLERSNKYTVGWKRGAVIKGYKVK